MKKMLFALGCGLFGAVSAFADGGSSDSILDLSPATTAITQMKTGLTTWIGENSTTLLWFGAAFLFLAVFWLVIKIFKRGSKG